MKKSAISTSPEGVPLKTVVEEFMKKINKTLDDVKDVKVEGNFITVFLMDDTEAVIEIAAPGESFPTRH